MRRRALPMKGSKATSVLRGAALTVAMRWTDRLIGIASTLILARILVPADFGVIAMASLVIGLVDVLFDVGVNIALIQNSEATPDHYHTAWTLRVMQAAVSTGLIVASAPWAADYFGDPRVTPVLQVSAVGVLLVALENIGVVDFQKKMRFTLDFRFSFSKRIVGFIATVTLALLLRSYWALVIGSLVGRAVGVVISYQLHPMRPRFTLVRFREIFAVSQWMMLRSVVNYLSSSLHKWIVGGRMDAATTGGYALAQQISSMPSTELLAPLNRVLFPAFVRVKHDDAELKRVFLLAQGVQTLIVMPLAVGLALLAREAVVILLGAQWAFVVPFVQVLALAAIAQSIAVSGNYLLMTRGEYGRQTLQTLALVLLFLFGALVVWPDADALGIAHLRLGVVMCALVLSVSLLLNRIKNIRLLDILATVTRPAAACVVMALVVLAIDRQLQAGLVVALLVKGSAAALAYAASIALLWRLAGRPAGSEVFVAGKLRGLALFDRFRRGGGA